MWELGIPRWSDDLPHPSDRANPDRKALYTGLADISLALLAGACGILAGWPDFGRYGYMSVWFGAIGIGVLLLLPARRWAPYLFVLIGCTIYASNRGGWSVEVGAVRATIDVAIVIIAVLAIRRYRCMPLRSNRDAWVFILILDCIGVTRAAVAVAMSAWVHPNYQGLALPSLNIGLATAIGMLALVPFTVLVFDRRRWPLFTRRSLTAALSVVAGLLVMVGISDLEPPGLVYLGIGFMVIPVFVVLAVRMPPVVMATGLVATVMGVAVGTTHDLGPFAIKDSYPGAHDKATLTAQIFLVALCLSSWILAASVSESARMMNRLRRQVNVDAVTGLRSRRWMTKYLEDLLAAPGHTDALAMFIDLTQFSAVRLSLGFAANDELLHQLADEIEAVLPTDGQLGRFTGDRLLMVVPGMTGALEMNELADKILRVIATERVVRGKRLAREGSVGIAVSGAASTAESLLRDADLAVATAVIEGSPGWRVFELSDEDRGAIMSLEHEIREGLESRQFVAYYQPKVRLPGGQLCGFEALARWQHPVRGVLAPGAFMAAAEQTGLIIPLGLAILDQACAKLAAFPSAPPIAVNVSPIQLAHEEWLSSVLASIDRHRISPDRLILELTETAIFRLTEFARSALVTLRDLGVGLHVDDFGTGFSSLSNLKDLPVSGLKLDRSFVSALSPDDPASIALVRGLAGLANGLGLQTVAEGVETEAEARLLADAGWATAQGYLFGYPAPSLETVTTPVVASR